jgi:hypothetical protein
MLEGYLGSFVCFDQVIVYMERAASGRKAEDEWLFGCRIESTNAV